MKIADLKSQQLLLFEALTGSRAYGTDLPTSDHDIRGVFILPKWQFYGLTELPQVADERNDMIYFELRRFFDLLIKNNPNMLEMLAMPPDCILFKHPLFDKITPALFLSKICRHTFAGYALAQIQKARGLNKKIVNPVAKERKSILDFCYVLEGQGSVPVLYWLKNKGYVQELCGLVNIPHFRETYALFYDKSGALGYRGILHKSTSDQVALSSIPKGKMPDAIFSFNKDGYQTYCKNYREYWEWVEKRNPARYEGTVAHGKKYDAKNMMHTFRLLDMAEEIAKYGMIHLRRPNRDFLLSIRAGEFEYDDLLRQAEERIENIGELFEASDLPEKPDFEQIENVLVEIRSAWYSQKNNLKFV